MSAVRAHKVVATIAVVATLAGCTSAAPEPGASPPAIQVSPSATTSPAPDTIDEAGRVSGTVAATRALTAFLRPDLPYETWWAELKPLLTQQAIFAYEYTDPRSIPSTSITGDPVISAAPSGTALHVLIPTGEGQYLIVLYRENKSAGWAVDRLTPPAETAPPS